MPARFPANTTFNRGVFGTNFEDAIGTLDELKALKVDPKEVMSCGDLDDPPGVLRCRHAGMCEMAWKGQEGEIKAVAINAELKVIEKDGKPVLINVPAGGPKDLCVWRKDIESDRTKTQFMPCYRFLDNLPRWRLNRDLVKIRGIEGDGRMFPMHETREYQQKDSEGRVILDSKGIPKTIVEHVTVQRAIPFHPRPHEVMKGRREEVEMLDQVKRDERDQLWGDIDKLVAEGKKEQARAGPGPAAKPV